MNLRVAITIALTTALVAGGLSAQDGQGTLMRALDEPFSLTIEDMPITLALDRVAESTGLSIHLGDDVLALLPHGEETRVRIMARNVKLRKALTAMLAPMCLQWRAEGAHVVVTATEPLRRIGRRPTFTEVEILARLHMQSLKRGRSVIQQLRELTGVEEVNLMWHRIEPAERAKAMTAADRRLPCTGAAWLDAVCHGRDLTWYVWGTDVMIIATELQAARQLRRIVTVEYRNLPLDQVIIDLARRADLRLRMDPGVLNIVAAPTRQSFTLLMDRATVAEAFEAISGATGLIFAPEGLALRVSAAEGVVAPAPRKRSAFIVTMMIAAPDGQQYRVMFRPDDLPPKLIEQITQKKAELIRKLWQQYGVEIEPAPAAAATTQPARPIQ